MPNFQKSGTQLVGQSRALQREQQRESPKKADHGADPSFGDSLGRQDDIVFGAQLIIGLLLELVALLCPPLLLHRFSDLIELWVVSINALGDSHEMQAKRRLDGTGPFVLRKIGQCACERLAEIAGYAAQRGKGRRGWQQRRITEV